MPLTYPHLIKNNFKTVQRRYGAHLCRILGNNFINTIINGGEVCGRHADDARLIHASVTAGLRGGIYCKLPSSMIILINGRLFSLGSRVCTRY